MGQAEILDDRVGIPVAAGNMIPLVVSGLHANMPCGQTAPGNTFPVSKAPPTLTTAFGPVPMKVLTYEVSGAVSAKVMRAAARGDGNQPQQ